MASALLTTGGRSLSGLERVWLAADGIQPPFVNQLVVEGKGRISAKELKEAVEVAGNANPGLRLRLKGWLGWSRWVPGPSVAFRVVDGTRWDGNSPKGAPFLEEPLDPFRGPVAEVLWVEGSPPRLVIRSHHAVTDGKGSFLFAEDLFCALRGEPVVGAAAGPKTDAHIAAEIKAMPPEKMPRIARASATEKSIEVAVEPPSDRPSLTGKAHVYSTATTWARLRLVGRYSQLLPRVIRALSSFARKTNETPLRIDLAVDLRRFSSELRSTANLTGILHMDLANLPSGPDAIDVLEARILSSLPKAAEVPLNAEKLKRVPLSWMVRAGRKAALKSLKEGRYPVSATLSNLGWQDLRLLRCPGFSAERAFWIPPGNPGLPLFLTLTGDDEGVELCGAMPVGLADEGRLENLLSELRADLLVDQLRSLRRRNA